MNDVWSSTDGIHWGQQTGAATWPTRSGHAAVVHLGKLWILGGFANNPKGCLSDVWSTTDGVAWVKVIDAAPWVGRIGHATVVHDGKMWVIGGRATDQQGGIQSDVWCSTDGAHWTEVMRGAPWGDRMAHSCVVFGQRIWLLGGIVGWIYDNDIWSTSDGSDWELLTLDSPWPPRSGHTTVVFNDRIWVLGGFRREERMIMNTEGDVWSWAPTLDKTSEDVRGQTTGGK